MSAFDFVSDFACDSIELLIVNAVVVQSDSALAGPAKANTKDGRLRSKPHVGGFRRRT